jgi:hypothetical protein
MIYPIFDRFSALIDGSATSVGPELQEQVDEIEKVIEQTRDQARAACHDLVLLIYEERIETPAEISDRKISGPANTTFAPTVANGTRQRPSRSPC